MELSYLRKPCLLMHDYVICDFIVRSRTIGDKYAGSWLQIYHQGPYVLATNNRLQPCLQFTLF